MVDLAWPDLPSVVFLMYSKRGTMTVSFPRVLFAISSLGLGHATRSLAVINDFLARNWQVDIVSTGNALELLKRELAGNTAVCFKEMADYPPLERGLGWRRYVYLFVDLIRTWGLIRWERREVKRVDACYDCIFSDGRYGFYSRRTPSFIITHQVAFMPPRRLGKLFTLTRRINLRALKRFDTILIPDFPSDAVNLSGILSHSTLLADCSHCFVGILSSYRNLSLEKDLDYLFVISGYLLEHKEQFVSELIRQSLVLPGRKAFILGQKERPVLLNLLEGRNDLELYAMVDGQQRQKLFNRAKMIIGRAGYTTIMDLAEFGKSALLIPTPNQTEQEYLGRYLDHYGIFASSEQKKGFDLVASIGRCRSKTGFNPPWRTEVSLKMIRACIAPLLVKQFFSVIVPAHNEEKDLTATIAGLKSQNYPADRYEVIIVENGSSDRTFEIAQRLAEGDDRITVLQSARGVSRAKNAGLAEVAKKSEWVIFCDADTVLGPSFLHELNTMLNRSSKRLSVGTCSIKPNCSDSLYTRSWFRIYDVIHRVTRTSYALQFAAAPVARKIGFHPELELAEDLVFIKGCREHGDFFFLDTDQVSTSTRRFNSVGYLRLGLYWLAGALVPVRFKRNWRYHVIR